MLAVLSLFSSIRWTKVQSLESQCSQNVRSPSQTLAASRNVDDDETVSGILVMWSKEPVTVCDLKSFVAVQM